MSIYDPNFESTRLNMLAKQYSEILEIEGKVYFSADDNEDHLAVASWSVAKDKFKQISDSGFKIHLMELLDIFITYRSQCNQLPKREGIVHLGAEGLNIEWVPDGFYRLYKESL